MKKLITILCLTFVTIFLVSAGEVEIYRNKDCNKENLYSAIKTLKIEFPDLVFAQILLESGNLKSKLTKTNKNFLGMRLAKKRETTAIGELRGFAIYDDWYSCLQDYALYQNYVMRDKKMTRNQYISFLSKRYAQTSSYKSRINRVLKENKEFLKQQDSVFYCSTI